MQNSEVKDIPNPTIATVAKSTGVSMMTVSRVVNNKPGVAQATRERVLQVINELGYTANPAARNLARGRTNSISLMLPNIWSSYMSEVARGVGAALSAASYSLVIYTTDVGIEREHYHNLLLGQSADGVIMVAPCLPDEHVKHLLNRRRPCVVIDPCPSDRALPSINVTNWAGTLAAMEHLIALGHRRIGFISGVPYPLCNAERLRAYRDSLLKAGLKAEARWVKSGDQTRSAGAACTREWLAEGELPTAIFAGNDDMAMGVIDALMAAGLKIPEDVSVVGFDDVPMASQIHPGLTTVHQPLQEIGQRAAELLLAQINGQTSIPFIELPTELIIRGSTGPARKTP